MEMKIKRLNYVDMVKGLAILEVVCYHLLAPNTFKTEVINHILFPLLAAFFIFSGYFYKPGKRTFRENVLSRAKSLLVPFVKYGIFFWLIGSVYMLIAKQITLTEAFGCLRNFFGGCIWNRVIQGWFNWDYYKLGARYMYLAGFWFLPAMFFACVIFFPVADRTLGSDKKTIGAAVLLFALTGVLRQFKVDLPYNIQIVPFWTAFMLLGAFFKQKNLIEMPSMNGAKGWGIALAALAAGLGIAFWRESVLNTFRGYFPEPEVLNMAFSIISAFLFNWGLAVICRLTEEAGVRVKELAWIGSHSMTVYIWHYFIAWGISTIFGFSLRYQEPITNDVFLKSAAVMLGSLVICILIAILEEKLAKKKAG